MQNQCFIVFAIIITLAVGCTEAPVETPNGTPNGTPVETSEGITASPAEHSAVAFSEGSFQSDVLESSQVVLVDCWAPWCGPCVELGPVIEQIAADYGGKAVVGKLNVDDAMGIAEKYGVNEIPALLFFKDGEVVEKLIGVQPKRAITRKLDGLIGA